MIGKSFIHSPSHYVTGRKIEPICVIEDWKLDHDHHLACVVKYIARAGRKNPILEDLMKAEWYLERALSKENVAFQDKMSPEQAQCEPIITYLPQSICDDWQLSDSLCSTIINIYLSVECQSHLLKEKALKAALDCLREEITIQEMRHDLKLPVTKKPRIKDNEEKRVCLTIKKVGKDHSFQFSKRKVLSG